MKSSLFRIRPSFAVKNGLPNQFVACVLRETARAVYVYGRGDGEEATSCVRCGRKLTHPVSVLTGIGPECGQHWWDESVLGPYGFTEAHAEVLKRMVQSVIVDGWIPRSTIESQGPSPAPISVPEDHRMRPRRDSDSVLDRLKAVDLDPDMDLLLIRFPYEASTVAQVKTLPGRRWVKERRMWTAPFSLSSLINLRSWGFGISDAAVTRMDGVFGPAEGQKDLDLPEGLRPYQEEGVRFIAGRRGRALLGDEQGLGKTPQALAWVHASPEVGLTIAVVPACVKVNWAREAFRWAPECGVLVINGRPPKKIDWGSFRIKPAVGKKGRDIVIINYDILSNTWETYTDAKGKKQKREVKYTGWVDYIIDRCPDAVLIDEIQYAKNRTSARTKAVMKLAHKCKNVIGISGTPATNRPVEFYPAFKMIEPGLFPSFWAFAQEFCGAVHNGFGWDFSGSTNESKLHEILTSTIMLRRLKKTVATELPPKRRMVVPVSIANRTEYIAASRDLESWLEFQGRASNIDMAEALTRMTFLKQIAARGKMPAAIEWINNYLDGGDKLVVFAHHREIIDLLMDEFPSIAVKLDGRTKAAERQRAVDRFQEDPFIRLFVGNLEAAGVGITLTAAHDTCFVELGWNSAQHDQAEDRVHRIGQEAESVGAYYLVAEDTIEEDIIQVIDHKREVLAAIVDGERVQDRDLLTSLLANYSASPEVA